MSLSSENPRPVLSPEAHEYSTDERRMLLEVARESIEAGLAGRDIRAVPPTQHLADKRGAFTSLHIHGQLRGCIGYIFPTESLYKTVAETARAAAFEDPRFEPLSPFELANLEIEISVLSPLEPIHPEDVVVGRHGLLVTQGNRRGLLLPQVPVEWEWDRESFLAQTCRKAGLPSDAWQHGAELQAFTAEAFGDSNS